jgi:hypothetical protein
MVMKNKNLEDKIKNITAGAWAGLSNVFGVPLSAEAALFYLENPKEFKVPKGKTLRNSLLVVTAAAMLAGCGGGGNKLGPISTNYPPEVSTSYNSTTNTLSVRAEDIDGIIAEMYQNGASILGDDTNPAADVFEAEYTNLPAGDHTFRAVDDCGDDDSETFNAPYESVTATASLDQSVVQHNMDAAAEVYASVSVSDGGYNYADWFVDGVYVGTSLEGEAYGVNVDWVGTKPVTAELRNSLDEVLDTVSAGNVEGLNTAPDAPKIYRMSGGQWVETTDITRPAGFPLQIRVELPDTNNNVVESMDYQSGTDSWGLFSYLDAEWGSKIRPTSDSSVPNADDVYILRDPEGDGSTNLYELTFNTTGKNDTIFQFKGREETTSSHLESIWTDLNVYIN